MSRGYPPARHIRKKKLKKRAAKIAFSQPCADEALSSDFFFKKTRISRKKLVAAVNRRFSLSKDRNISKSLALKLVFERLEKLYSSR
jgi:hypothetical protein